MSVTLLHPEGVGVSYTRKQLAWDRQQVGLVELWVLVAVWSPPLHTRGVGNRALGLDLIRETTLASHFRESSSSGCGSQQMEKPSESLICIYLHFIVEQHGLILSLPICFKLLLSTRHGAVSLEPPNGRFYELAFGGTSLQSRAHREAFCGLRLWSSPFSFSF